MSYNLYFFILSITLGFSLAMDAFSVSLANGLNEPTMKVKRIALIALIFALFQGIMPLIGWSCVHFFVNQFKIFQPFIPWIALALLLFIGIKMLIDGLKKKEDEPFKKLTFALLLVQGIATSIDALSVGFTFVEMNFDWLNALVSSLIISILTFGICVCGIFIGKKFGTKLSNKASIFGGIVLIIIGIVIFIRGMFF